MMSLPDDDTPARPSAPGESGTGRAPNAAGDATLSQRLDAVIEEGTALFERFDHEVRDREWHPFVAADYAKVRRVLESLPANGARFLEWGSATGTITIMADLLGFEAYGIELDSYLVEIARDLARRHGSGAHFVHGSFLPSGYRFRTAREGDGRLGTIGEGPSAYGGMGRALDEFQYVYAFPWAGEEALMLDIMRQYGARDARLLLHSDHDVRIFAGGRLLSPERQSGG
jgi:hypothetical protein